MSIILPDSQLSQAIKTATLFFKTHHFPTSHEEMAHQRIDGYLGACMEGIEGPIQGLSMFMPSHYGKSTIVSSYIQTRVIPAMIRDNPELAAEPVQNLIARQKTILHVTLTEDATPASVAIDIIQALNPEASVTGNKATLWHRAYQQCAMFGVKLLVLDEIQHLASTGMKFEGEQITKIDLRRTRSTPDALKVIMQRGSIPVMFVGIEKARRLLIGSTQFNGRIDEIPLRNLDWSSDADRIEFMTFAGRIAKAMETEGLLRKAPRLVYDDTPLHLFIACDGRLGLLCKILAQALVMALVEPEKDMTVEHLSRAVDIVCVSRGEIQENPFHTGAITEMEVA